MAKSQGGVEIILITAAACGRLTKSQSHTLHNWQLVRQLEILWQFLMATICWQQR